MLRLATWNIEFFDRLFNRDNTLKSDAESRTRLEAVAAVLQAVEADLIGVTEGPNTGGNQSTVTKLEAFADAFNLSTRKALTGFTSRGVQEIALLYNDDKIAAEHKPGGAGVNNPPFNREFRVDTDEDRIKEVYAHFRPPLEAEVTVRASGESFCLIVAHIKSKGIFSNMDRLNWERASRRNRLKIFAEALSVRQRVDEFLGDGREVVVMGDINDGPGFDFYEFMFGKSGVELIMGDFFEPDRILRNYVGRPKMNDFGFTPSSARFRDSFTGDFVNVLIDHILASPGLPTQGAAAHIVWNPFQADEARPLRETLLAASDHFPVTLDLDL